MLAGGLLAIGGLAVRPIAASTSDQVSGAAKATSMAMVGATAGRTTGVFVRREW